MRSAFASSLLLSCDSLRERCPSAFDPPLSGCMLRRALSGSEAMTCCEPKLQRKLDFTGKIRLNRFFLSFETNLQHLNPKFVRA
jgi:hypothetical protein